MEFTKNFDDVFTGSWVETAPPGDHRYNLSVFVQIASLLSDGDHLWKCLIYYGKNEQ